MQAGGRPISPLAMDGNELAGTARNIAMHHFADQFTGSMAGMTRGGELLARSSPAGSRRASPTGSSGSPRPFEDEKSIEIARLVRPPCCRVRTPCARAHARTYGRTQATHHPRHVARLRSSAACVLRAARGDSAAGFAAEP